MDTSLIHGELVSQLKELGVAGQPQRLRRYHATLGSLWPSEWRDLQRDRSMSCPAMISTHVFQHLSSYSGIEAYLDQTYRALAPDASICFQLPVPGADKGEVPSVSYRALDLFRDR